jgi:diacylglycerol kinase family enzyme
MQKPNIAVLTNPFARAVRKTPGLLTGIAQALGAHGILHNVKTIDGLETIVKALPAQYITHVGIIGGDGSISLILAALARYFPANSLPRILILRGGTVNVLAGNLGLKGHPEALLRDFIANSMKTRTPWSEKAFFTITVNDRLGFLFASGSPTRFLTEFYKQKGSAVDAGLFLAKTAMGGIMGRNPVPLLRSAGDLFSRITKVDKVRIIQGSEILAYNASAIFVSTIPQMAWGIPLYYSLDTRKPLAEMLCIELEGRALVRLALETIGGKRPNHPKIHSKLVPKISISLPQDCPVSIDGDILEIPDRKITLEIGPRFVFSSK